MSAMVHDMTWDVIEENGNNGIQVMSEMEVGDVSGGFVCGGLCLAGAAFAAGALLGSGIVIGWRAEQD